MPEPVGPLHDPGLFRRHSENPIVTPDSMPYESILTYNPGVVRFRGRYHMLIRSDLGSVEEHRRDGSYVGFATSDDGVRWTVDPEPRTLWGTTEACPYDPRITRMDEGWCAAVFAHNKAHGLQAVITRTDDFRTFEQLHWTLPESRDVVLFPRRIDGFYWRLDRPFPLYNRDGEHFDIWISRSPDLVHWGGHQLLLSVDDVWWANIKLGAGTPPIETPRGWLVLYHGVDDDPDRSLGGWEASWSRRYSVGAMLLDLDDPRRVVGHCPDPVMVPTERYELADSYRNGVLFATALLPDGDEARLYYGACDNWICLATTHLDALLDRCVA